MADLRKAANAISQPPTARAGKVTRELVLATALEIIDRDGADALSMRRLGAALERDPMILYRHVPDKAALLDGVVETVLAQLSVDPADPDWTAQLRAVARDYRALALTHPNVVPLLVTRPLARYDGAAELERGLDILSTGLAATLSPPGMGDPPALPHSTPQARQPKAPSNGETRKTHRGKE